MSRLSGSIANRAETVGALATDATFQWRTGMWDKAVRMTRDRPLTGWGVGSFPVQQALYYHPAVPMRSQQVILERGPSLLENAHNTYFQIAAELGLPGIALYLGVFVAFFWTGIRALPRMQRGFRQAVAMGCMGGVAAQMVSAFGSPAWEFAECSAFLWLMLGLGMAAAGVGDRGRGKEAALDDDRRTRHGHG
jgi:O-antigen ligase